MISRKVTGWRRLALVAAIGGPAGLALAACGGSSSSPTSAASHPVASAASSGFNSFQSQAGVKQGESVVEGQANTCAKAQKSSGSFSLIKFGTCLHTYYASLTASGAYTCGNTVMSAHSWTLKSFGKKNPDYKATRQAFAIAFADTCVVQIKPSPTGSPSGPRAPPTTSSSKSATPTTSGGGA